MSCKKYDIKSIKTGLRVSEARKPPKNGVYQTKNRAITTNKRVFTYEN